jgi:replicative DNA helicase
MNLLSNFRDLHKDVSDGKEHYNVVAEQIVLGNLLSNNNFINEIADFLSAKHFYVPVHQRIYQTIYDLVDKGMFADVVILKNKFDQDESLIEEGGSDYLKNLLTFARSEIYHLDYARQIADLSRKRELIKINSNTIIKINEESDIDAIKHIERLEQKLLQLVTDGESSRDSHAIYDHIKKVIERTEEIKRNGGNISGVTTGYKVLNGKIGGFKASELIIIAARPGMGKTAFALNLADKVAEYYSSNHTENEEIQGVGFFSLEMSSEQLALRLLSMESEVNSFKISTGQLSNQQMEKLITASFGMAGKPIYIDDTPAITISALKVKARRMKRKNNIGILFVDYLQLLRGTNDKKEFNRVQEISEISQGLKAIAKELNIPVIALSQLSREVEKRVDKRPLLSDLRESGSIEQDADIVMFIYRDAYYDEMTKSTKKDNDSLQSQQERDFNKNTANIIVAKNRSGPVGEVVLGFNSEYTKFEDFTYTGK